MKYDAAKIQIHTMGNRALQHFLATLRVKVLVSVCEISGEDDYCESTTSIYEGRKTYQNVTQIRVCDEHGDDASNHDRFPPISVGRHSPLNRG